MLLFHSTYELPILNKLLSELNKSIPKDSTRCISSYDLVLITRSLIVYSIGILYKKQKIKFMKNYNFSIYSVLETIFYFLRDN